MNKKLLIILIILLILVIASWLVFNFFIKDLLKNSNGCPADAKLCSDGSYVGRIAPDCDFEPCPKEDLIIIKAPIAYEEILSPVLIKGKARGFWFFEASFPIKLYDENNNLIATAIAQTDEDWMTEDFVSFEAELIFPAPKTLRGFLIFEKDNPSGLDKNADELKMPIAFKQGKKINLYYYNPELDKDENGNVMCSYKGLEAVERVIPITQTPIQDAIELLLEGELTMEEQVRGIETEYPLQGFSLKGASLKNGVLTLEFNDPNNKTIGGSCRVGVLWFQIEATAKQFSEVQQVKFLPEELFQP